MIYKSESIFNIIYKTVSGPKSTSSVLCFEENISRRVMIKVNVTIIINLITVIEL